MHLTDYRWTFVALLLGLGFLTACGDSRQSVPESLAKAEAEIAAGKLNAGVVILKSAVQGSPDSAQARLALGKAYLMTGSGQSAYKEIAKAAEAGAPAAETEWPLVHALWLSGQYDKALERAKKAVGEGKKEFLVLQGLAELDSSEKDLARELFQQAIDANIDNPMLHMGLARIAFIERKTDLSIEHLDKVLEREPHNVDALILKGEIALARGESEQALGLYAKALQVNRLNLAPMFGQVRAHLAGSDIPAAEQVLDELGRRFPTSPAVAFYKGVAAFAAKRDDAAADFFREVLSVAPSHGMSQFYLGLLSYRSGNLQQAADLLAVFQRNHADYLPAKKLLAAILARLHKTEEAVETLDELGAAVDADARMVALKGSLLYDSGRLDDGIDVLQKAADLDPQNQELKTALLLARIRAGKADAAVEQLKSEISAGDKSASAEVMLAFAQLQQRNFDAAITTLAAADKAHPNDPFVANTLGLALRGKGDMAAARDAFQRAAAAGLSLGRRNLVLLEVDESKLDAAAKALEPLASSKEEGDEAFYHSLLGRLALLNKDGDTAVAEFEKARRLDGRLLEPRLGLMAFYTRERQLDKAAAVGEELQGIAPDSKAVLLGYGRVLLERRELNKARAVAERARSIYKGDPGVELLAGLIALAQGDIDAADQRLGLSYAAEPRNSDALAGLCAISILKRHFPQAQNELELLAKMEPNEARTFSLRGDLAAAQGDEAVAAEHYAKALGLMVTTDVAIKWHQAAIAADNTEGALKGLAEIVAKYPQDLALKATLAQSYADASRSDEAIALYEELLRLQPHAPIFLNNLAILKDGKGDPAAFDLAKKAHESAPDSPEIADTYGWMMVARGSVETAVDVLAKAVAAAPDNGEIRYHYAVALLKGGDSQKGMTELKTALDSKSLVSRAAAEKLHSSAQSSR